MPKIKALGSACCGCGACSAVCPAGCISMVPDAAGFLYPEINDQACVNCGLCDKTCPSLTRASNDQVIAAYWAISKDDELLKTSSSGGVFGELAKWVLDQGGAVYGFAFADSCRSVVCARATDEASLEPLRRSKYVQGSVGREIYRDVEGDLRAGRRVLFSGTACQIAGLTRYLEARRIDATSLIKVDVVCHGAPSPRLWRDWLEHVSGEAGSAVSEVNFRDKATGWESYSVTYGADGDVARSCPGSQDWYMKAFLANASLRASCFECPAKGSCSSDLTLGDYWGVRGAHPEVPAGGGVSAVVVRTETGAASLEGVGRSLESGQTAFGAVLAGNPCLLQSVKPYGKRRGFMELVEQGEIGTLVENESFKASLATRLKGAIRAAVSKLR